MTRLLVTFYRHRTRRDVVAVSPVSTNLVFPEPNDWELERQDIINTDLVLPGSDIAVWLEAFRRLGYCILDPNDAGPERRWTALAGAPRRRRSAGQAPALTGNEEPRGGCRDGACDRAFGFVNTIANECCSFILVKDRRSLLPTVPGSDVTKREHRDEILSECLSLCLKQACRPGQGPANRNVACVVFSERHG
jgi:hypothetical protein